MTTDSAFSQADEVPVVVVVNFYNLIITRGHNQVELLNNSLAQSEYLPKTAGPFIPKRNEKSVYQKANVFSWWKLF